VELKLGYKHTEVGVIPEEWADPELADIARDDAPICYGIVQVGSYKTNGIPVLAIKNLNSDYSTNVHRTTIERERPYSRSRIQPNDLLISVKGTVGRVGIVPAGFQGNISRDLARIRVRDGIVPQFVFQMLQSDLAQKRMAMATVGTTRMELSIGILKEVRIPLPLTTEEQHTIAAALSDADALIHSLERLLAKKRDLKQGAMQELLTGKKRLPGFTGTWSTRSLRQCLIAAPDYGINAPGVPSAGNLPAYLRITDIDEHGRLLKTNRVAVNHPLARNYLLGTNDIVFARTGASVGKTYLYNPNDGELVFAGFLIRVRVNPEQLIPSFLAAYTRTMSYWNWVRFMSTRSGQPGINGNEYAALDLRLPPTIDEQMAIAAISSGMDAEIAALEQKLEKARQVKEGMMQELLTGRIRLV
jgi:type I restriction enzyme S subunit